MNTATQTAARAGVIAVINAAPPDKKQAYIDAMRVAESARRKASEALFAAFYAAPESVQADCYDALDAHFDSFPATAAGDDRKPQPESTLKTTDIDAIEFAIEHIEKARAINRGRLDGIDTALHDALHALRNLLPSDDHAGD